MESNEKMIGYILYAVGIIGGVEGATEIRGLQQSLIISVVAMIVIIIASYLLVKK